LTTDRRRDARATVARWRTLRFTYRQLTDEPLFVIATVARALGQAEAAAG